MNKNKEWSLAWDWAFRLPYYIWFLTGILGVLVNSGGVRNFTESDVTYH